ncbi:MAG: cell division protein FtsZ [Clostridia bacterium]|nr:cell division protein FtsZ [Clostridia bacterium]MBQ7914741.1 cell division protein FtsZ [Clostridia bacterium]MBQ8505718.1 cell division protein FtsZ [Clostridia bacterium]
MDYTNNGSVAKIMIVGVGGGGGNAVNAMMKAGVNNVDFLVLNTDQQALSKITCRTMAIGEKLTKGLGAGANPEVGKAAALESKDQIQQMLQGVDLLFIAAGMGGGTGTGAAPVVAQIAKELEILTVAVVTKPFNFEGTRRMKNAEAGIENLKGNVDSLVIVQNEKLNRDKNFSIMDAFAKADEILLQGIRGITEIVVQDGRINLDLADVKCVMRNSGMAHMGIGEGKGKNKTIDAIRKAVYSPLLETTIQGASSLIVNFRGGEDLTLDEVTTGVDLVRQVISPEANVLFGVGFDEALKDEVQVTLIATGFSGGNDESASFFSSEAATRVAATTIQRQNVTSNPVAPQPQGGFGVSPVQQPAQPAAFGQPTSPAPVNGTIPVEEDPSIPPFLRRMK